MRNTHTHTHTYTQPARVSPSLVCGSSSPVLRAYALTDHRPLSHSSLLTPLQVALQVAPRRSTLSCSL